MMKIWLRGEWVELHQMKFEEIVDFIAGEAIQKLIKGVQWRSIIWDAANVAAAWNEDQKNAKK